MCKAKQPGLLAEQICDHKLASNQFPVCRLWFGCFVPKVANRAQERSILTTKRPINGWFWAVAREAA
ncbi:hypothetical protein C7B82_24765 [Stenomitos frigidus ULC18]|uniref:Uncharacterized protein n=1 Tax=Stenomitos frigidus ULC18 TaxID=2107698 RepID=A0A2T1DWU9_9CYAN|nr:hypothetical protein C7B82_24765 [Stenomitos frigidus ULC18]